MIALASSGSCMSSHLCSEWEDYFKWQLVHRYLPFLGTNHLQAFQLFREATEGVAADSNRASTCVTSLQAVVPYTLARLYAKYILPIGTIPQMSGIITTIKTAFNKRLENTTWLDQQTINASIEKVLVHNGPTQCCPCIRVVST